MSLKFRTKNECGSAATQIDYFITRQKDRLRFRDVKVIPGEACVAQHRLLVPCMATGRKKEKKWAKPSRIKAWKLKDPQVRAEFEHKVNEKLGNEKPDCD